MPLNDVTIIVTAGHRPGYLRDLLKNAWQYLPECKIVVVSDSNVSFDFHVAFTEEIVRNVILIPVPHDTWLTRKRNIGVSMVDTKYALLAADDFQFTAETRAVVIKMVNILEKYNRPDVIAGTFNGKRYEGFLEVKEGEYIREIALDTETATPFAKGPTPLWQVDIAVNWFLARTAALVAVPWDERIGPIGGEHADWFLDMKAADRMVVWTPGLNIKEQPKDDSKESPDYGAMRQRVWDGHKLFLKKRGVKRYLGFGETL